MAKAKSVKEGKAENLEEKVELYDVSEMPKSPKDLYVPQMDGDQHRTFMEKLRDYWQNYKPKKAFDYAHMAAAPGSYAIWKLPKDLHQDLNKALKYVTKISALTGQEEVAVGTGIAYAASQIVYGIKTRSGKHVISGLQGVITHGKKIDKSKLSREHAGKLEESISSAENILKEVSDRSKR